MSPTSYSVSDALRKKKIVDSVSGFVGSLPFFIVHIIWFGSWLYAQMDIELLTLMVSLEAIILMLLLLMQQNHQVMRDDARDEADLNIDRRTMKYSEHTQKNISDIQIRIKNIEEILKRNDKKNP